MITTRSVLVKVALWFGLVFTLQANAVAPVPELLKAQASAPKPEAVSWMLVEQSTGWVLAENNADKRIPPASLSKIMTSYVVFEALKNGTISLDDKVRISEKAWKTGGSRMFLKVDTIATIEELIKGLIVQSGNDAAVSLAEYVAGDVVTFAEIMNQTAARLGMTNSHFTNPNGLPDPDHYTTARDLMILTTRMIEDFPDYYAWYSEKEYTYNDITQNNRNRLLWLNENVDGVKTGHTQEAGYCLIGSAVEDNMRLTAIVIGAQSDRARVRYVESLLRYGYNYYEHVPVYQRGDSVTQVPVYKGATATAAATVTDDVNILVPRGKSDQLTAKITTQKNLVAPVALNSQVGTLAVYFADSQIKETPLVIMQQIETGSIWIQLFDSLKLWWQE